MRKLAELEEYHKQISEFSKLSIDEYAKDWKTQRVVERTLQIMIETCVDIANHIISDEAFRTPVGYSDTFKVLEEKNVVDTNLSKTMQDMAKFRNIIVHGYDKIDEAIIVGILRRRLSDFMEFKDAILAFLKKQSNI